MLLTISRDFAFEFNPYLISIIGGLLLIIGFFIRNYFKSEDTYRTNLAVKLESIIKKLDSFLYEVTLVQNKHTILEKDIKAVSLELERCTERNCGKIFNNTKNIEQVEGKVEDLNNVVKDLNHEVNILKMNHKRNHPED